MQLAGFSTGQNNVLSMERSSSFNRDTSYGMDRRDFYITLSVDCFKTNRRPSRVAMPLAIAVSTDYLAKDYFCRRSIGMLTSTFRQETPAIFLPQGMLSLPTRQEKPPSFIPQGHYLSIFPSRRFSFSIPQATSPTPTHSIPPSIYPSPSGESNPFNT